MKRNKIVSILEYSARNKMLVGIVAVSLIGAGGVFLSNNATISNNTMGINKTVLAGTLNNSGNKACVINGNDSLVLYTSASNSSSSSSATTSSSTSKIIGTTSSNNSSSSTKVTSSKSSTGTTGTTSSAGNSSSNNTNTTDTTKSANGTTAKNGSSHGYTYGTSSELNSISGSYYLNNYTKGANSAITKELSGITINSNGVTLANYLTDSGSPYQSLARLKVSNVSSSTFTALFGVTPSSLGLHGSNFNVYSIGDVFIYQLPNQNIMFSYEDIADSAINTTNNIATSNVRKWYGNYTVGNKVGQLNGYNSYGVSSTNITGQKLVIQSNEFQYGGKTIKNPQYYIIKVSTSDLLGTSFSGADLSGANTIDVLAVLSKGENMSNFLYNNLPSYTGCMSGAWAADIAMPIILGPNGNVQVMNNNFEIYSASQGVQVSSTSTSGSNQGTSTQETTKKVQPQ